MFFIGAQMGRLRLFLFWAMFFFLRARAPNPSWTRDSKLGIKFRCPKNGGTAGASAIPEVPQAAAIAATSPIAGVALISHTHSLRLPGIN